MNEERKREREREIYINTRVHFCESSKMNIPFFKGDMDINMDLFFFWSGIIYVYG